jgi:hypothetical protein
VVIGGLGLGALGAHWQGLQREAQLNLVEQLRAVQESLDDVLRRLRDLSDRFEEVDGLKFIPEDDEGGV